MNKKVNKPIVLSKEMGIEEMLRLEHPTQYQEAFLFKNHFQKSNRCKLFRLAWGIAIDGFNNYQEYQTWYKDLIEKTNTYQKSEKYIIKQKKLAEKRKEWIEGKITKSDFLWFSFSGTFAIPLSKFDYDVDTITLKSGKPIYWRDYIEQCLLFKTSRLSFPTRPRLDPKLKWNFEYQFYELIIENVFPDTTTKDFDDPTFTKKLKEMQVKLPGYNKKKSRLKKDFDFGLQVIDIDEKAPNLSDFEKVEHIKGEELALTVSGEEEKKIKDKIRQTRLRMGKYFKK